MSCGREECSICYGVADEEPSVPPAVSAQDILERVAARLRRVASQHDGPAGHALLITAEALEAEAQELDA